MLRKLTFKTSVAAILVLSAPVAVYAQTEDSAAAAEITEESAAMSSDPLSSEDEKEFFAIFGKIFDEGVSKTPINPVQLKLAETTAAKLLPNGSMKTMMTKMFDAFLTPVMNALPEMSSTEIMLKVGIYEGEIENLNEEKRKTITAMLDPTRKERGKQMIDTMTPLLDETMTLMEPPMRTGIARAYARKFSAEQLSQINGFFTTPTGAIFAAESYALQADPEVMRAVYKAMPGMLKMLKEKVPSMEAEMKKLPKERSLDDLNKTEMASLAKMLNVTVAALEESSKAMKAASAEMDAEFGPAASESADVAAMDAAIAAGDAAEGAVEASPYADETGDEPWYNEENWVKADRAKISAAFKKRDKAENASSAAYSIWSDAFEAAVAKSRDKYKAEGWKPAPVVDTPAEETAVETL